MVERQNIATPDLIEQWLPEMGNNQKRFAMKIFKAQEVTIPFSDVMHKDRQRDEVKRMCRVILDCVEDIPLEFFRNTFSYMTIDKVRRNMRSIKDYTQKYLEELKNDKPDISRESRYFATICKRIDTVVEKLLYCSNGYE
jgi:hypothetical protein